MVNVNQLLEDAIIEISELKNGEIFLVKDLFKGYLWNRIPRKDRLLLGTLFLNWTNQNRDIVVPVSKTSSGQQKYKKN
jgi:hypothetical protein